jgi:diguanylate cyclase (GGDEF)-like protein
MATPVTPIRPPLVLLVNDQEWWARSLESMLAAKGYAVLRAFTGLQAIATAKTARPDAVFIESRMPDMDGSEICRALNEDPDVGAGVPIVLTTSGSADRERRLAAYQSGAWEFVSEPLDGEMLMSRLGNLLKARRETERLRSESLIDEVTGLYNLRGLARRAREMGAEAHRRHASFACVAIAPDPDRVEMASSLSSSSSSRLAEELGDIVRRAVRSSDAVGRLGQCEFAIVTVGTENAGAMRLARRMQRIVDDARVETEHTANALRVSAGYYAIDDFGQAALDPVEILVRATNALRDARAARTGGQIRAYQDAVLRRPSDPSRAATNLR